MSQAGINLKATLSPKHKANFVIGSAGLITLCIAWFFITSVVTAFAQESEQASKAPRVTALSASGAAEVTASAFDPTYLPSLDLIGPQTDITVFLQNGVPAGLRLAALRRAWAVDPAIRDFKGLEENDWNFNDPKSILGFGELGPEVDIEEMLAQIVGETPQLVVRAPRRPDDRYSSASSANAPEHHIFDVAHN